MVKIEKWYGRLGNNIIQLCNAYMECKNTDSEGIIYPPHDNFIKCDINSNSIKSKGIFFHNPKYKISNIERYNIFQEYISKILIFDEVNVPEDILLVHIRNGDIFCNNPHPSYIQPPLSYYLKIFENEKIKDYNKVWVLCSGEKPYNPVMDELKKMGCLIKMVSISKSIGIIKNCNRFVSCNSSFSKLFFLNNKADVLYFPDNSIFNICRDNLKSFMLIIDNYIKMGEWKASDKQIGKMLKHNINNINIKEME